MNRTPPKEVREHLRKEVGFGCPILSCGNPYLEWHHFNPPWNIKEHHDPNGMIALCREHHFKADHGAFTKEQLIDFKRNNNATIEGRFDWMRKDLLAIVGGMFFYNVDKIIQIHSTPIIWFTRNSEGCALLNINMLTTSGEERIKMVDNYWMTQGFPSDFICPPSGKLIEAKYSNGDYLKVVFSDVNTEKDFMNKCPNARIKEYNVKLPITAVEITNKIVGGNIQFEPDKMILPNQTILTGFIANSAVGIQIGDPNI